MSDAWFVYIARCSDGSLYTGIARNVEARLAAHDSGRGARYTRGRGPLFLCGKTKCKSQGDALRLELAIKALSRAAKLALTRGPQGLSRFARARTLAATRRGRAVSSSKKSSASAS